MAELTDDESKLFFISGFDSSYFYIIWCSHMP